MAPLRKFFWLPQFRCGDKPLAEKLPIFVVIIFVEVVLPPFMTASYFILWLLTINVW